MYAAVARTKKIHLGHSARVARPTCERQTALAGVTVDSVSANAVVQTRPRGTLVYILLAVHS